MSLSRSEAAAYLGNVYATMLTDVALTADDDAANLKYVIDSALRDLGVSESDLASETVGDSDVADFLLLLDFRFLERARRALAMKMNVRVNAPDTQASEEQKFEHVTALLEEAKTKVESEGLTAGTGMNYGYVDLDFLEPPEEYDV